MGHQSSFFQAFHSDSLFKFCHSDQMSMTEKVPNSKSTEHPKPKVPIGTGTRDLKKYRR